MLDTIKNFAIRNGLWVIISAIIVALLAPELNELRMLMLIIFIELVALALSGLASYIYTKVDFIESRSYNALGAIFLGVHFLVGLGVVGLYYAV